MIALLRSSYQAAEDLHGANRSFDRYTSAYNAGDAQSALLQLEGILYYLTLYKDEAANNAALTESLRALLVDNPLPTTNFDPATLITGAQQELLANGFPLELERLFTDLALSDTDINAIRNGILNFSPNDFINLPVDQGLEQIAQAMSLTASLPNSVPEPGSLVLVLLGLVGLIVTRSRMRQLNY